MKVVQAKEMSRIEKLAYLKGAQEELFMNYAGEGIAETVRKFIAAHHLKPKISLLCGRGNNAGDAYVAGKILLEGGFDVRALAFFPLVESSTLCQKQAKRFEASGGKIIFPRSPEEILFENTTLIVDGVLGTGFHGNVEEPFATAIRKANASGFPIIAIDMPSGIDGNTGDIGGVAIQASETLFLGLPKTGCFLGESWNYVGKVRVYDFGLGQELIAQAQEDFILITDAIAGSMLPPIKRTRHKYQAGYVVGIGGSLGMPGAPILSSLAALRAGAGIVRLLHPKGMEAELAGAPYELVREGFLLENLEKVHEALDKASSVFVGPGMGTSPEAENLLKRVLPKIHKPCVVDAEALTLLAKEWITVPQETVLTPHIGEMRRLLGIGEEKMAFQKFLEQCQKFSEKKKVTLVLKGAPTFIFHPYATPFLCANGDPGMATAGSGDVLTGMIAAFLAEKVPSLDASILGVYFHALAGEEASKEKTPYCMIASDIIRNLPQIFKRFQNL